MFSSAEVTFFILCILTLPSPAINYSTAPDFAVSLIHLCTPFFLLFRCQIVFVLRCVIIIFQQLS